MDDWPPDLVFLQDLEELMKCPICFDLMKAPVMLPGCDHNYCSLCIRRYFTLREQCPTCGSAACSNQLRSNGIMEKIIEQFKKIRSPLQSLCINKLPESQTLLHSDHNANRQGTTRKRNLPHLEKLPSSENERNSSQDVKDGSPTKCKSRPASRSYSDSDDSDVQILSEDEICSLQSSTGSSSASKLHQSVLSPSASVNQSDGLKTRQVQSKLSSHLSVHSDGSETSAKENAGARREASRKMMSLTDTSGTSPVTVSSGQSSTSGTTLSSSHEVLSPLVRSQTKSALRLGSPSSGGTSVAEKVPCPVCGVPVVTKSVNHHLDFCLGRQEKWSARRKKRKLLPKLVYNLLTDKDIRKRLKDLGLTTKGDRQVLIKRHHDFTLYHNADCDSLAPKDLSELVKEFEDTQKLQTKLSTKSSANAQTILRFTKDSKQEDIEKARKDYVAQHKDQFKSLIKEARSRMKSIRRPRSASASVAPDPENGTEEWTQKDSSESGTTSGSTFEKNVNCSVIHEGNVNGEVVCRTEAGTTSGSTFDKKVNSSVIHEGNVNDEVVCRTETGTTSETKETRCSIAEGDFDDDELINDEEVVQEETLESETSENTVAMTQRSCVMEDKYGIVAKDKGILKRGACSDNVCLSEDIENNSIRPSGETVLSHGIFKDSTDSGEDMDTEVFACELKSQSVQSPFSVKVKGKRALRLSKLSWQDTDMAEMSVLSSTSEISHSVSRSNFHKTNPDAPSTSFHKRKKYMSNNSQPVNSIDESCTSTETSQLQEFSDQSGPATSSEGKVLQPATSQAKCVESVFPKPRSEHSLTHMAGQINYSSKNFPQLSDECQTGEDRVVMNAESNATESSMGSGTDSDPVITVRQTMFKDDGELIPAEQEGRKKRKSTQRAFEKGQKDAKRPKNVRHTDKSVTNLPALEKEDVENHDESKNSSALEVNQSDLFTNTNVLSAKGQGKSVEACEITESCSFDPGASDDCCMKNSGDCFELNLSDCENEESSVSVTQREMDCASPKNVRHLQNDQEKEMQSKCKLASRKSPGTLDNRKENTEESDFLTGNTESSGEANLELPFTEAEQETDQPPDSHQVLKPKSLLKKISNTTLFKKSVRFAGLRARVSDIQNEEYGHNILKKRSADNIDRGERSFVSFPESSVARDEAALLAGMRMTGNQMIKEPENVGSAEYLDSMPSETTSVDEISECTVASQVVNCPHDQPTKTHHLMSKQKKQKKRKSACQTAVADSEVFANLQNTVDDTVESLKACVPVETCEQADDFLEERHKTETNRAKETSKRREKRLTGFTSLKVFTGEQISDTLLADSSAASDTVVAQKDLINSDHESEMWEAVMTQGNESGAECQSEKGSTELIYSPTSSTVQNSCTVTGQSCATENSCLQKGLKLPGNTEHTSQQKDENSDPELLPERTIPDNSADLKEQSEDIDPLKNKKRRKWTCSLVGKNVHQIVITKSCTQMQTSGTGRKKRKTSHFHCSAVDAVPDLCTNNVGRSSGTEQQNDKAALHIIPESYSDIPEKPLKAERKTRKHRFSKAEDDPALSLAMSEIEHPCGGQEKRLGERRGKNRGRKSQTV